ncbi:hypothetical protein RND71_013259 [Anisodus tanguticus]|uniref:Uncharacterized protein n=1 Tax=Anisodus tanguticus TaxID=243964 RepID=A0AAE1SHC1_9SOLA|nr:hypothetical protein RND71_013259 [Anisodus tanguticus]
MFHIAHLPFAWSMYTVFLPKKIEKEKLARKGPKPEDQAATSAGGSGSAPSAQASTPGVSNDNYRNYGVLAGLVTGVGALGWYLMSKDKNTEEVQD